MCGPEGGCFSGHLCCLPPSFSLMIQRCGGIVTPERTQTRAPSLEYFRSKTHTFFINLLNINILQLFRKVKKPSLIAGRGKKKPRRSFAPRRFPVYNLMKSFRIWWSMFLSFSVRRFVVHHWRYKSAAHHPACKGQKSRFVEAFLYH